MMTLSSTTRLFLLGAVFGLGLADPLMAQDLTGVKHANVVRALRRDLEAVPTGSQPTDAQRQALAADLGRLFRRVNPAPTVTLDFLAGRLADATAQGRFGVGGFGDLALQVTRTATGSTLYNNVNVANLTALLLKAGLNEADAQRIAVAARALPYSFMEDNDGITFDVAPSPINPGLKGYKYASFDAGMVSFESHLEGNAAASGPVTTGRLLSVTIEHAPVGKYQVSVTTRPNGQTVVLGTLRVRLGLYGVQPAGADLTPPVTGTDLGGIIPSGSPIRYGTATFGTAPLGRPLPLPLPAGLSLSDVTGVTVTDAQGVPQFAGSFLTPVSPLRTRGARLHLVAGTAAPTAGGSLDFTDIQGSYPGRSFLFTATGLPPGAVLTLSVDGVPVGPVTTGPTGNLFVKADHSVFDRPPESGEVQNILPATVDLSKARAFVVSDAQGNVLLSGALLTPDL